MIQRIHASYRGTLGTLLMIVPILAAIPIETPIYYLGVQDAETKATLWNDSRKAGWMHGGAVADLVKDLFKSIRESERRRR